MKISLIAILSILISCSQEKSILQKIESHQNQSEFSLIFSHNVHAELEPCGCQKFPLGGVDNIYHLLQEFRTQMPVIYIDTGDSFYASITTPKETQASAQNSAQYLGKAYNELQLDFFLPGDFDFAQGSSNLLELLSLSSAHLLLSNLKKDSPLFQKIVRKVEFNLMGKHFLLLGVIDPNLYPQNVSKEFLPIEKSLEEILKPRVKNKDDIIILLSHSGLDQDKRIALKFPTIDWIIGAHSQSFTQLPIQVGKTQIVQVLSKNHQLGQIHFQKDKKTLFKIHPVKKELSEKDQNNPLKPLIREFRTSQNKIQKEEQKAFQKISSTQKAPSVQTCYECHQAQSDFWKSTSHSLAYLTLVHKEAEHNDQCIHCHSLGYQKDFGFPSTLQAFTLKDASEKKQYIEQFSTLLPQGTSIRELSSQKRKSIRNTWDQLDQRFHLLSNYTGVQCLHCHRKDFDHPFSGTNTKSFDKNACLQCHNKDQSPQWYHEGELKQDIFLNALQKVSCPKGS